MKCPRFLLQACLAIALATAGCTHTTYERKADGSMKVTTTGFAVKREIGRINIDEKGATIDGAKSDQAAVAQLLGEALLAKVK